MSDVGKVRRWPLVLIAAPAAVAVWSGWVGLGALCGFGLVQPLPGIVNWHLNTAITLPVGVESYGAYALGAWLTPGAPAAARTFARRSAVGSLCLGVLGQVAYHLLAAAHAQRAPWPVVILVSCLPVVTLGFGAALTHLLRVPVAAAAADEIVPVQTVESVPAAVPEPDPAEIPAEAPGAAESGPDADPPEVPRDLEHAALIAMKATVAASNPLSLNQLCTRFSLTRAQATRVRRLALGEPAIRYASEAEDDAGALIPA